VRDHYLRLIDTTVTDQALLFPRLHRLHHESRQPFNPEDALDRILRHALANVPRYRALGVSPDEFPSPWKLLAAFPLTDRFALQADLPDFCDDHLDPVECRAGTTSGTSGVPVKVIHDVDHQTLEAMLALRRIEHLGLPRRRRILMPMKTMPLPWVEYVSPLMWHSIIAEFGTSDSSDLKALVERSANFRPDVVFGHPSDCVALADLMADYQVDIRPQAVQTYGEYLSPANREHLSRVFHGARIVDSYGLYEFGTVAAQCADGRYHVIPEKAYVEVVDDDGTPLPGGEVGEVVLTGLSNRVMPLIRYRTFDHGAVVREQCGCGAPAGQILSALEGRQVGQITLAGGRKVRADALTRVLRHQDLQRFQTIVAGSDRLEVRIYRSDGALDRATREHLYDQLREVVGQGVTVVINEVGADGFLTAGRRKHLDLVQAT
jgi:phenylacetate-CoA ligase